MEDFPRSYFGICGKIMKQKKPNRQELCKISYDGDVYQVLYLSQWDWVLTNAESKFDNVVISSPENILSVYSRKTVILMDLTPQGFQIVLMNRQFGVVETFSCKF